MTVLKDDFHKHMKEIVARENKDINPYDISQLHKPVKQHDLSIRYHACDPYNNSLLRDTLFERGINQSVHTMRLSGNNDIYKEAKYALTYLKDYCSSVLGNDLLHALDDASKKDMHGQALYKKDIADNDHWIYVKLSKTPHLTISAIGIDDIVNEEILDELRGRKYQHYAPYKISFKNKNEMIAQLKQHNNANQKENL